jgi:solute carrier family 13 (sodium-dependent dicarboxylate transporter), member 2/3/5
LDIDLPAIPVRVRNLIHLIIAFSLGYAVSILADADPLARNGLGLFTCIAWLWISEALPISLTALLIPLFASVIGIFSVRQSLAEFANPIIYLFMGGFALAAALQKYELDRLFALRVLSLSRGVPIVAILLLFVVTAILSMWISNTATTAMMLPLAAGLLAGRDPDAYADNYLFVFLGLAYAANIGGMATLIGSPPNAIAAAAAGLDFTGWLSFGLPAFLLLFPLMILVLYCWIRPRFSEPVTLEVHESDRDPHRTLVLVIFALTAAGWVFSSPLSGLLGISGGFDSLIALMAIALLIASGCLTFSEFTAGTNWSILILFGGGLTLSAALKASGASAWLAANIIAILPADNLWLMLLIVCLFVIFLTELVSNTASAALLVPLFLTVATEFGLPIQIMVVLIALCASCAFMLPVATPPNALAFASGFVPQKKMMSIGLVLNVLFAMVLASLFWLLPAQGA